MKLQTLYGIFAGHKESRWIMEWPNAQALYKLIKENPIQHILDLGTGIGASAAVAALALSDKGEIAGEVHTVDQYDKCIKLAEGLIPEELKRYIIFHKAEPKVWSSDIMKHTLLSVYDDLPIGDWGLIINDGPSMFLENEQLIDLPNGTIHKMTLDGLLRPGTLIAYDGRITSLALLERFLGDNFYMRQPGGKTDFNVLEKKDISLKIEDAKLIALKEAGYFSS